MRLILASASPRRRALLEEAGYSFEVDPSGIDEPEPDGPIDSSLYAANLAWRKAAEVARRHSTGLILAADTVCAIEGRILNKPLDRDDAERMLRLQEGREIIVVTALCLHRTDRPEWLTAYEPSVIWCRRLTEEERDNYLDSGHWQGKAGGYGLQDDDPFISIRSGSWSGVVGLPMELLDELLKRYPGVEIRSGRS